MEFIIALRDVSLQLFRLHCLLYILHVSILILMEFLFNRGIIGVYPMNGACFNPYFNGCFSSTKQLKDLEKKAQGFQSLF